jgi:hypothetical protein
MQLRARFLIQLVNKKNVLDAVATHLRENHVTISDEKILYLLTRSLARIQTLGISVPESMLATILPSPEPGAVVTQTEPEREAPFRPVTSLAQLAKTKALRTPENQVRSELLNYYIPHYQRTLFFAIAKAIPDINTEVAEQLVRQIIDDAFFNAVTIVPENKIELVKQLQQAISNANPKALAAQFNLDEALISQALKETCQKLSVDEKGEALEINKNLLR